MSDISPRRRITVTGQVQGVGFRPFVYRLAQDVGLAGQVRNAPEGVIIEVQGSPRRLDEFLRRLEAEQPPLARIMRVSSQDIPPVAGNAAGASTFAIHKSTGGTGHDVLISPDISTCPDCLAELSDKNDRRFLYPFTNCTNCGPRFTITRSIPYDRPNTSMGCFPLCADCEREYNDPANRRFH
ncbi:MAG: hydrogenase maturation protein HypF, partial [Desulfovibrio sp.]|nr:hydrogenase maturation protein HypF [Desulfovibrio sp.]